MNVYMFKYVQHVYMNMLSLSFLQDDLPNLRTNVYGYILISVNLVHFGKFICSNNIFKKYTKKIQDIVLLIHFLLI